MMFRSHILGVYRKPGAPLEDVEFVPEGFSFAAFILTGLWTLYHRLWLVSFLILAINFCFNLWLAAAGSNIAATAYLTVIQLGFSVLVGVCGNDWRAMKMEAKGYELVDIVTGDSFVEAQRRHFDRMLHIQPKPQAVTPPTMPTDGILAGA